MCLFLILYFSNVPVLTKDTYSSGFYRIRSLPDDEQRMGCLILGENFVKPCPYHLIPGWFDHYRSSYMN